MSEQHNAIGYGTLEEWEQAAPHDQRYRDEPNEFLVSTQRADTTVYLMLHSEMQPGSPPSLRSVLTVQRLDADGNIHYWQLHLSTVLTMNGTGPMFEQDLPLVESGQVVAEGLRLWLMSRGFHLIVRAKVAYPKDLVLLDGHTQLLRYSAGQGWSLAIPDWPLGKRT